MATANGSPRARALAAALKKVREKRGMSARELADRLSIDQSHLSRIETGKKLPNVETVARILGALQTTRDECQRILDLARNAAEPNWLTVGMPGVPLQLAGAVESERAASAITEWAPMGLPGLLQTSEYARALAEANNLNKNDVEARVTLRIARREILTQRDPVNFIAIIGEMALREEIGSSAVMKEQLRYLIKICERSNVVVHVVPFRAGWHPGIAGPFVLYEFLDAPPFVHFEHYSSGVFVTDSDDVQAYRNAIDLIKDAGLDPDASVDFVGRTIVEEWSP